jgi:hypothetical protein
MVVTGVWVDDEVVEVTVRVIPDGSNNGVIGEGDKD